MKCVLPICVALVLGGCSAGRELAAFEAASSEKALIRWHRKGVSLVWDAVCARSSNDTVLVRLYKQSPASLAEFRLGPENDFTATGRLAGRGWAGPAPSAPAIFSSWIAFLAAYQDSAGLGPGSRQLQTATTRVASTKSDGRLKALSVSNTETGEVISAVFN
ncbi:MAG TPA: hypothetical protein VIS96_16505 [Terrimicrobiaceae bacterium]